MKTFDLETEAEKIIWDADNYCLVIYKSDAIDLARRYAKSFHEWQPIETAPRDGTRILILADGYVKIARSFGVVWSVFSCEDEFYSEEYHLEYPTHWMPLPEPPAPEQSE